MHELSLATEMVRTVEDVLRKEGAGEVVSIYVSVGALSGVEREPLEFCFPIAAEGTPLAGARLVIEEVPIAVRCGECEKDSQPEYPMIECVECGSPNVEITAGREFVIKSLEVR